MRLHKIKAGYGLTASMILCCLMIVLGVTCLMFPSAPIKVLAVYGHSQTSAQERPTPKMPDQSYRLTKQELETWARFEGAAQAYNQAINQIVTDAIQLPLEPATSTRIHAELREARMNLNMAQVGRQSFLWQLRAKHNCDNCEVENGELRLPAAQTTPPKS